MARSAGAGRLERLGSLGPFLPLGLALAFGLVTLRTELAPVLYPNDEAVHSTMVRVATEQWQAGHIPFSVWYSYLSLGSPYLVHYQSTPAVLTGLLGTAIGAQTAFGWSLYLILATFPLSVYLGARLFGFGRWPAAGAAGMAPLLNSIAGYGFGPEAYVWIGNGLWSQEWGMWMLPIVLGLTWQAVSQGRRRALAGVSLGAIIALHFLTAYLAGLMVAVWVLLGPTKLFTRLKRALVVTVVALLLSAYVTVPLVVFNPWAAVNEIQVGTFWDNSYGARQVLDWLFTRNLFDNGRLPLISVLAAVGFLVALVAARRRERARALLAFFLVSLGLYFGRPTPVLRQIIDVLPFNSFLLLHRYVMGVQLAGLLFAGIGAHFLAVQGAALIRIVAVRLRHGAAVAPAASTDPTTSIGGARSGRGALRSLGVPLLGVALLVAYLEPGWRQIANYEWYSALDIRYQQGMDTTAGADLNTLIATAESLGPGRIYAGLPSNWGGNFRVGEIQVYVYLSEIGAPSIGFTERTSSLMSGPEVYFDESSPDDYQLFGVHYLLLPLNHTPPVPAHLVSEAGDYTLWTVGGPGYVQVIDTSGTLAAGPGNLGTANESLLSDPSTTPDYPTLAYDGRPAAAPTLAPGEAPDGSPGTVLSEHDDLVQGRVESTVRANRTAVVLLKASYDPGWQAIVDGLPTKTEMIAPALVGVEIPPGTHRVDFTYAGYRWYPELLGLTGVVLVAALAGPPVVGTIRRRRGAHAGGPAS